MTPETDSSTQAAGGVFRTTHWSVVVTAAAQDTTRAQCALETLCRTYWQALFVYVRRRGYGEEDAKDLTQAFFARLLEKRWLAAADEEKGRFRTFLITAMERFLCNEWDKAKALKRGGGQASVPIQFDSAETRYGIDPQDTRTPEQAFEYRWAVALLDEVVKRLQAEYEARGQLALFLALKACLVGSRTQQPYSELAANLRMEETAVKVAVHRLRQRYRGMLREEIAQTVVDEREVDAEMKHLFAVLSSRP